MMTMSALLQLPAGCHAPGTRAGNTTGSTSGGIAAGGSGSGDESTSSLLSFVDMASSNIKLALDKPVRSKRKVNHRKYLQKQLKRCAGGTRRTSSARIEEDPLGDDDAGSCGPRTPPTPPLPTPPPPPTRHMSVVVSHGAAMLGPRPCRKEATQTGLQNKSLAALFDPRTLHERCCTDPHPRSGGGAKVPLRQRNLPASFFTEPACKLGTRPDGVPSGGDSRGVSPLASHPLQTQRNTPDNNNIYYEENGALYGQRPSCRHGQHHHQHSDGEAPDTVDRMLSGAPPVVEPEELLSGGDPWSAVPREESSVSRASANTTPCSSSSGGGLLQTSPDMLQTAMTAIDVARKMPSPPASPSSSCGGGASWTSGGYHGGGKVGAVTPAEHLAEVMSGISTPQHGGHSSRGSTPVSGPSPHCPPVHLPVAVDTSPELYQCATSHHPRQLPGMEPFLHPEYQTHHPAYHPTSTTTLHSRGQPDVDTSVYYQPELDVRCGVQLPAGGGMGGALTEYPGYDTGSMSTPFASQHHHHQQYQQHQNIQHHPAAFEDAMEAYRDQSAPFWQGTAVYGQLSSCYSYL